MNIRSKERILLAASTINTESNREAAILGGIVNVTIREGHFSPSQVMAWTDQALGLKSSERIKLTEVIAMTKKFQRAYLDRF